MKMQITKTFEIDEKIAPHIKKLNNKGYLTDMCCAGHPEEKEAGYIIFDTITSMGLLEKGLSLPKGWVYDAHSKAGGRITIRMINDIHPAIMREFIIPGGITDEWIEEKLQALDEWIDSLPTIKPCMCSVDCSIIEGD